jgi:hypothetical protein
MKRSHSHNSRPGNNTVTACCSISFQWLQRLSLAVWPDGFTDVISKFRSWNKYTFVCLFALLLTACERERIVDEGPDTTPPLPPTGMLLEAARDGFIFFSWIRNRDLDFAGYIVYRAEAADSTAFIPLDTIPEFYYLDVQRSYDTLYWYRVTAIDRSGNESPPGIAITARSPNRNPPDPPRSVVVNGVHDAAKIHFSISWTDVDEADLAGFRVYRSTAPFTSADPSLLIANTEQLAIDDNTVSELSHSYHFAVTAVDRGGLESSLSPISTDFISPRPQLLSPASNEAVGALPTFSWVAIPEARSYRISLSQTEFGGEFWSATITAGTTGTVNTRYAGTGLAPGNTYYWRVSSITAQNGRANGVSEARRLIVRF